MLCKECDKVFTHPEGLQGLADSSNIAGHHHDSLVAFRSAAQEDAMSVPLPWPT